MDEKYEKQRQELDHWGNGAYVTGYTNPETGKFVNELSGYGEAYRDAIKHAFKPEKTIQKPKQNKVNPATARMRMWKAKSKYGPKKPSS